MNKYIPFIFSCISFLSVTSSRILNSGSHAYYLILIAIPFYFTSKYNMKYGFQIDTCNQVEKDSLSN